MLERHPDIAVHQQSWGLCPRLAVDQQQESNSRRRTVGSYIMLTRLSPEALKSPESVGDLNKRVEERIKKEGLLRIEWVKSGVIRRENSLF